MNPTVLIWRSNLTHFVTRQQSLPSVLAPAESEASVRASPVPSYRIRGAGGAGPALASKTLHGACAPAGDSHFPFAESFRWDFAYLLTTLGSPDRRPVLLLCFP